MRASIIVVTGPPGAGKSTVARELAHGFGPRSVHLCGDNFWRFIVQGWQPPWKEGAEHQNSVVTTALAAAAVAYAQGGYGVVVDAVIGPWLLEPVRRAARAADVELHYVVLRPVESVALLRATTRGGHALVDEAPIRAMHAAFGDLAGFERHVIDSSTLSAAETVRLTLDRLAANELLIHPDGSSEEE